MPCQLRNIELQTRKPSQQHNLDIASKSNDRPQWIGSEHFIFQISCMCSKLCDFTNKILVVFNLQFFLGFNGVLVLIVSFKALFLRMKP